MTVDVFEAKSAASKLFDKLDRDLMAPLTDASWAAASAPPRQRRDSHKNEFFALAEKCFKGCRSRQ
jgi:hypothetical protein